MAEENQQAEQQPVFQIQRVYLKDLSLEQPNSPAIFLEQDAPAIEVAVDVGAEALADGIFEVRNIPAEQLDPLLGIGCPNIIYPHLRANIADVIPRAGFPPIHLAEINFEVFYQQRLQALAEQQTDSTLVNGTTTVN